MLGCRLLRSKRESVVGCKPASSASFSCVNPLSFRIRCRTTENALVTSKAPSYRSQLAPDTDSSQVTSVHFKPALAYLFVIAGFPSYIGQFIGGKFARVFQSSVSGPPSSAAYLACSLVLDALYGMGASLVAFVLFWVLSVRPSWKVPLILVAWITIYFVLFHQPFRGWLCYAIGVFAIWLLVTNCLLP